MSEDIDYGQKKVHEPIDDTTIEITTNGFFADQVITTKIELRKDVATERNTIYKDLVSCLDVLYANREPLHLVILKDKLGNPKVIQKSWTVEKSSNKYPKKHS